MRTLLAFLFAFASLLNLATASAAPPNVVFFLADDLGQRDLGCYGSSFYETPNLDRLAKDGALFTDAYAACPVCSPTRASIMSGQWPQRTGITDYIGAPTKPELWKRNTRSLPAPYTDRLALDTPTFAKAMKGAGYATFFAGKWHLGPEGWWPENQGFDINMGGIDRGGPYGGKKYFSPYGNPRLLDGPDGEHLPDRLATETAKFIETNKGRPFFAFLSFYSVHTPLIARDDLRKKYEEKRARLGIKEQWGREHERDVRLVQEHAVYAAMVEAMDLAVGKVLAKLDELGLRENTIVIFTSDNGGLSTSEGWPTSNLPLRGGKGWMYEGGIREPLLIRWPAAVKAGIPEGKVCRTPVGGADLPPTFFRFAGLELPWTMHGHDLTPLLQNSDAAWPHTTIMPFTADKFGADCDAVPAPPGNRHKSGVPWYVMLAERRFKYIRTLEANEPEELYDLQADPEELTNLATDPQHADTLKKLRIAAIAELKRTGAKMGDSLPPVLLAQNAPAAKSAANTAKSAAPFAWVSPLANPGAKKLLPPTVKHATFKSPSMGIDVGYYIYLPPGYEKETEKYPVVYHLHGGRPGAESKSVGLASYVDKAIAAGKIKPTIYVFPNGGPVSWYDILEAKHSMGESVFVKELIPHIDATYRTWGTREGRALEGYSQGGRGTTRIMFKHPELFLSVAPGGSGYGPEKRIQENDGYESETLRFLPLGYNAWDLAKNYAGRKDRPPLSILVWDGTKCFNYEFNLQYSAYLKQLGIAHDFLAIPDVPHTATGSYDVKGNEIMQHHQKTFDAHRQAKR